MTRQNDDRHGSTRARPIRFAYLVEAGVHGDLTLDAVFAHCYNNWGGRFSLVVPCIEQKIHPAFWPWLERFDPDIVYSYVDLSRTDVAEIHERLSPSEYVYRQARGEPRLDVFGFRPDLSFKPLASLSTVFSARRYYQLDGSPTIDVIDCHHSRSPTRFLSDNFGTYLTSAGTSMFPQDLAGTARLITIVAPEIQADRRYGVDPRLTRVDSEQDALREFAAKRVTSLSLLSSWFAPRLEVRSRRWGGSFNLVVGDTFEDRVLFWNARSLIPTWLDRDLCCFRVTLDQLNDDQFLSDLNLLLRAHNHVNAGSGGQSHLMLRSTSVSAAALADAAERIRSLRPWGLVTSERIENWEQAAPTADELRDGQDETDFGIGLHRPRSWRDFQWSGDTARPPEVLPLHLLDAPPRHHFAMGIWSQDFALEHDGPRPRFSDRNTWFLPKRVRMHGAFDGKRSTEPSYAILPRPRASRGGHLTISVAAGHPVDRIGLPSAEQAFAHAFSADGQWAHHDPRGGFPANRAAWLCPSSEARYLAGVVKMAGGLSPACGYLLHPFLRSVFAKLGATPDVRLHDKDAVVNRLAKKGRTETTFDLSAAGDAEFLASLVLRQAQQQRSPEEFVAFSVLREQWTDYVRRFWEAQGEDQANAIAEEARNLETLTEAIQHLRSQKILFQGHKWTCTICGNRNWADLSGLAPELTCVVCRETMQAPVEIDWLFKPNDFVLRGLRDHSVLSLLWVLNRFRGYARRSLIFTGPTVFGFEDDTKKEADLLIIADGVSYVCEVKNSWTGLRKSHVENLATLAMRLRPDVALLAVMEQGDKQRDAIAAATEQLKEKGIRFSLMKPNDADEADDPYLPAA